MKKSTKTKKSSNPVVWLLAGTLVGLTPAIIVLLDLESFSTLLGRPYENPIVIIFGLASAFLIGKYVVVTTGKKSNGNMVLTVLMAVVAFALTNVLYLLSGAYTFANNWRL